MPRSVSNWSQTKRCTPLRIEHPTDEDELRALVREAREQSTRIKVVGARHSWSDIAMTDGILVSLDRMQRVLELDEARGVVRAEAGIRLFHLNAELDARGFALPIMGSVCEQSLAGVMSTGTHGSSLVHGNIPSLAVGLRLITGTGEILELDAEHPLLPAARVGLGALGILTQVSVRIDPAFRLCETTEVLSFADALASMPDIARSAEYVKLWWLPHTEDVLVFRYERTDEPSDASGFARWFDTYVINRGVFALMLGFGRLFPGAIPPLNRIVGGAYLEPSRTVGRSDRMLTTPMPTRHREAEYAIPVERTAEALQELRDLIERIGARVNFIQEIRFVKADDGWMSPASERDTCQLGAYMGQSPGIDEYFAAFEAMMKDLDGRPHWGKEFSATAEDIAGMYPRVGDFVAKARELDPDGVFRNGFLNRVLFMPP